MLGADVIGFQTQRSATNFIASASLFTDAELSGDGLVVDGRKLDVVAAPISIETSEFARIAAAPQTEDRIIELRRELGDPKHIILGADRMDYTKGIDVRLRAFGELLAKQPELAETVKFVQIAVPSRESIDDYEQMRRNIDQLAGRINSGYGHHMPVHYVYESLDRPDLIAYYRAADVMAVTPFADGMNLVAKEYVASRINGDGALVLSEFAGAARELRSALLVNPYDVDGVAEGLARALTLDEAERRQRMSAMRRTVSDNDLEMWVERAMRDDRSASDKRPRGPGALMRRWLGPRAEVSRGA
jgi:trehalose-6-phosphate synthase